MNAALNANYYRPDTLAKAAPRVRLASDADADSWNDFVDTAANAEVYHRYEWRFLLEDVFEHRCHYLLAEDGEGNVVGVLPASEISSLLFGRFIVSIPYFNYCGALGASAAVRDSLVTRLAAVATEVGAAHVELRHRDEVELEWPAKTDKISMQLSLPEDEEQLWQQFSSKLRAQVRRPKKAGATCRSGGLELLDDFYAVFSRNMRDLGTPVFPKAMFEKMLSLFPTITRVFVVDLDGMPAAAGITIGYRGVLEIPVASSLRAFNRQAVNMLLYWSVLQYAIREQYETFDFGRSTVDSGPHRFKKQWGAEPQPLRWHYWLKDGGDLPQLNPSNPKFRVATAIWQRLPLGIATYLGPKVIRFLA